MATTREKQINRALALMDRLVALIENEPVERATIVRQEPKLTLAQQERIVDRSPYWKDPTIRAALLSLYGRSTIRDAESLLVSEFGRERAPSLSTIHRLFQKMDQISGVRD